MNQRECRMAPYSIIVLMCH